MSQRKVRDERRKFIVEGWRALKDALNSGFHIDYVAVTGPYVKNPDYQTIIHDIERRKIPLKELTEVELRQVSDTVHSQGVLALVDQKVVSLDHLGRSNSSLVVVADRVADPGNLGSIIRTCDWFGVDALILTEGCVDLYNEKVVRSTAGSIFHLPVIEHAPVDGTVTALKSLGFSIIGSAGEAKSSYSKVEYRSKNAILVGSEASGLSPSLRKQCDEMVRIERRGKAESLNVVVACGIILSHIRNNQ